MKPAKRYSFRLLRLFGALMAVLSAVLSAFWPRGSLPPVRLTPSSATDTQSRTAHKADARPPLSHIDKLQLRMIQLLTTLGAEAGPMAFERQAAAAQDTIESLDPEDLPAALAIVAALCNTNQAKAPQGDLELRLLQRWGEQDIVSAARWGLSAPLDIREDACRRIGSLLAEKNLPQAISWASEIESAKFRESVFLAIAAAGANNSPSAALETCAALQQSSERDEIMSLAAAKWAAESPAAAAEWASAFSDENLKPRLLGAIAIAWGDTDPLAAGQFAIEQLSPGPLQERTALAILQRWALRQPQSARSWAEQFPAGPLRQEALATIARSSEKQELEFAAGRP